MNSKPHHGTALILAEQKSSAFENFSLLFDSLNYVVKPYIVSMDEIAELITKAAEKDHHQYDSFICCMSYTCDIDVSKFVEIIQSCDSLQGKPKLFFVASDHVNIPHDIGEDTLVWSCPRSTYTNQFKWFLQRYAHIMDLVSMLGYVSTSVSLFLPLEQIKNGQIKRRCCVIKSQLKSQIIFKEAHGKYKSKLIIHDCLQITLHCWPKPFKIKAILLLSGQNSLSLVLQVLGNLQH